MTPKLQSVPSVAVELLRLLVVIAGASLGFEIGRRLGSDVASSSVVSSFGPELFGAIIGAGLGYSLGGALARYVIRSIDRGERALDGLAPDQVVAGAIGSVLATLLTALVLWPVLLIGETAVVVPIFMFLLLVAAIFGFRAGRSRRAAVINTVGSRAGMSTRSVSPSSMVKVLDTSVAIDGRIVDVAKAGFLHGRILVPAPVLGELQAFADSADDLKRSKGKRGLDALEELRSNSAVELEVIEDSAPEDSEVDAKLVRICQQRSAALLTIDGNLARVADLAGVKVMDLHQLAVAMKPPVAVGDQLTVTPTRAGREPGQALAHLDDGTMIVVEGARERIGSPIGVEVVRVITTAGGRMAFARELADRVGG